MIAGNLEIRCKFIFAVKTGVIIARIDKAHKKIRILAESKNENSLQDQNGFAGCFEQVYFKKGSAAESMSVALKILVPRGLRSAVLTKTLSPSGENCSRSSVSGPVK